MFRSKTDKTEMYSICDDGSCLAMVDTGTSGIGVPAQFYDDIMDMLKKGKSCQVKLE